MCLYVVLFPAADKSFKKNHLLNFRLEIFRGLAIIGKLLRKFFSISRKLLSKPAGYQLEFLTMPKTMFVLIIALSFLQATRGASKYGTIVLILCFSVSIPFF